MKVIRKGKKPDTKEVTAECGECDCKFRFARSEARFHADWRDGDAYVVKCPECRHENLVAASLFA